MTTKTALIAKILRELRKAQTERWTPPSPGPAKKLRLPPTLPLGDGMCLNATDVLLQAVFKYSELCWENEASLKSRVKIDEFAKLAEEAFGVALSTADLEKSDADLCDTVKDDVERHLCEKIQRHHRAIELTLGCHLFEGDAVYPIRIGPVIFETRQQWCQRSCEQGKISSITGRRLGAKWSGRPTRKRKSSFEAHKERAVLDAIGNCPIACTVETNGLSSKFVTEKGLLAARLAMTALSLMWNQPSQGLEWMNLRYDGQLFLRHTVLFDASRYVGSSSSLSQNPSGRWTDTKLIADMRSNRWLFDQVGEALSNHVQPVRIVSRPRVMNALFLSLWWFHEACREPLDQIATTKFAASMDALVLGQSATSIIQFIGARIGFQPGDAIMTDGRTTKSVVEKIYNASRSRLIHGSSDDFAHDWTQVRSTAEVVGRLCLIAACDWLSKNPETDDLTKLSRP